MKITLSSRAVLLTFLTLFAGNAIADESYRLVYDAALLGIPIGKAEFTSRMDAGGYEVKGSFASAGIARLFDKTNGTVAATGQVRGERVSPSGYRLDYVSGRKKESAVIHYSGGKISGAELVPAPKPRPKDWVPVSASQRAQGLDPLSALVAPADSANVCRRRVSVFDGEMRADLVFSKAGRAEQIAKDAITCRVRFIPVAGYRKGRSTIKFLRDRARILVAFRPVGKNGHMTVVAARIGTKVGPVTVRARTVKQN